VLPDKQHPAAALSLASVQDITALRAPLFEHVADRAGSTLTAGSANTSLQLPLLLL
jgi:hypothetical protein